MPQAVQNCDSEYLSSFYYLVVPSRQATASSFQWENLFLVGFYFGLLIRPLASSREEGIPFLCAGQVFTPTQFAFWWLENIVFAWPVNALGKKIRLYHSRYKICDTVAVYYRITAVSMAVPSRQPLFFFLYGMVYGYPVHRKSTVSIRPYTVYGTVYSPTWDRDIEWYAGIAYVE
jgi:hypothetical protein